MMGARRGFPTQVPTHLPTCVLVVPHTHSSLSRAGGPCGHRGFSSAWDRRRCSCWCSSGRWTAARRRQQQQMWRQHMREQHDDDDIPLAESAAAPASQSPTALEVAPAIPGTMPPPGLTTPSLCAAVGGYSSMAGRTPASRCVHLWRLLHLRTAQPQPPVQQGMGAAVQARARRVDAPPQGARELLHTLVRGCA